MKKVIVFLFALSLGYNLSAGAGEAKVSHDEWNTLLAKHVSSDGWVDYAGFKSDQAKLETYLNRLKKQVPQNDWPRNERMAYWINAYNAFTIQLILNHMPLKSIMEVNGGKAWDLKFIELDGKKISLNTIEHDILRAKFKDPRIHFAVNCASVSCPRLLNAAFTGQELEKQLEKMAKSFVNNNQKNKIQPSRIQISKLFEWYADDFTKSGTLIDYLNTYSTSKIQSSATITYLDYDWNLNAK